MEQGDEETLVSILYSSCEREISLPKREFPTSPWVMLVAGSNGWDNYRHQIAHQNGIPDDQIVVMMYDDIAYNNNNPYPGKIINKPNGPDVYAGVPKDYIGEDVTAENFLAALKGDQSAVKKSGPKKVIASEGNDTIFVYLSDHGSTGLFSFPKSTLYAYDLIDTIVLMTTKKHFSKMVIYMESCHSGSMFTDLSGDFHVYAVTAARADENSYACYEDTVRKTYLADEFSARWMDFIETNDSKNKTFRDQFSYLQETMKGSHSCRFGDMAIGDCPISVMLNNTPKTAHKKTNAEGLNLTHLTPSHEVPFKILELRIKTESDEVKIQDLMGKYEALHQTRAKIERTVQGIRQHCCPGAVVEDGRGENFSRMDLHAFKSVAEHFRTTCFDWHKEEFQITLAYMDVFARLCVHGVKAERIIEVITSISG
ncbi:legumain-like isoform X2 [Triplophysa dalaica]|uniref:legumain-like isoform X2 n=1 Tax=Triplophysa dalaica TaxID=1582913 RepID=UPI0024DFE729|nr:legumain-like isoform X2 [Triplophysa dalaica]